MKKLEVGAWNKLPHYLVVGCPNDFYVWINENGGGSASKWYKGASAFSAYYKLLKAEKQEFINMVKALHDSKVHG